MDKDNQQMEYDESLNTNKDSGTGQDGTQHANNAQQDGDHIYVDNGEAQSILQLEQDGGLGLQKGAKARKEKKKKSNRGCVGLNLYHPTSTEIIKQYKTPKKRRASSSSSRTGRTGRIQKRGKKQHTIGNNGQKRKRSQKEEEKKESRQRFPRAYFFPSKENQQHLAQTLIDNTTQTIDVAMYTFTNNQLKDVLIQMYNKDIRVRVIFDEKQQHVNGSVIEELKKHGIACATDTTPGSTMHHKFAIMDNKLVATGSYNWTNTATLYNCENLVVMNNTKVVKEYGAEFQRMWDQFNK